MNKFIPTVTMPLAQYESLKENTKELENLKNHISQAYTPRYKQILEGTCNKCVLSPKCETEPIGSVCELLVVDCDKLIANTGDYCLYNKGGLFELFDYNHAKIKVITSGSIIIENLNADKIAYEL